MYKPIKGPASRHCVRGSVDGVKTAATVTPPTTTYFQMDSI